MLFSKRRTPILIIVSVLIITSCIGVFQFSRSTSPKQPTLQLLAILPLTGPAASGGVYLRNGIKLGRQEVERRYGDQFKLQVEVQDSQNLPKVGISVLQAALVRKRPDAVISGLSSVSQAIVPIVEQEGILTIATTTALSDLPKNTKQVIRVYPTSENFVNSVAAYMVKRFDRMAVMYINDVFGQRNQTVFRQSVAQAGKTIAAAEPFELTQKDARVSISRVLSTSPQAVFITGYGSAFVAVLKQLRELAPTMPLFSEIGFANPAILEALGEAANGILFNGTAMELSDLKGTTPQRAEAIAQFRSAYQAQFGSVPYQVAGFAYDSVLLLAEASLKSGSFTKPTKPEVLSLSPFQGVMGEIRFDASGDSDIPLKLMRRDQNQTVLASDSKPS